MKRGLVYASLVPILSAPLLYFSVCTANAHADCLLPDARESFGSDPYIVIKHYRVTGNTKEELLRSMQERGPLDRQGKKRMAFTKWNVRWKFPKSADAVADLSEIGATYRITVTLPHWEPTATAGAELREKWCSLYKAIVEHELGHIDRARQGTERITEALQAAARSDSDMNKTKIDNIANRIVEDMWKADLKYDDKTEHGVNHGVQLN